MKMKRESVKKANASVKVGVKANAHVDTHASANTDAQAGAQASAEATARLGANVDAQAVAGAIARANAHTNKKNEGPAEARSLGIDEVEKARRLWLQSLRIDRTGEIFSKLKPKGDPTKASKKHLSVIFVQKLKVVRGFEILSTLQDDSNAKYITRSRFETWLGGP